MEYMDTIVPREWGINWRSNVCIEKNDVGVSRIICVRCSGPYGLYGIYGSSGWQYFEELEVGKKRYLRKELMYC